MLQKCMFCGHGHDRDLPPGLREQVAGEIEKLVAFGVAEFWSGGMGTFDKMCKSVVQTEKRTNVMFGNYASIGTCKVDNGKGII